MTQLRKFLKEKRDQFPKERDKVFVVMPFRKPDPDPLWENVITAAYKQAGFHVQRADSPKEPRPITVDIFEGIETANTIIADLTDLNPNVLYEVGIAHARCDWVIHLAKKGQDLPFDLKEHRCIFYENLRDSQNKLCSELYLTLKEIEGSEPPSEIKSLSERTQLIIRDLERLLELSPSDLSNQTVLFSGFLSAFSFKNDQKFPPEISAGAKDVIREKKCLLDLAQQGCKIKCIITPPTPNDITDSNREYFRTRVDYLLNFLKSEAKELQNIDWIISNFRQKNFYIIGNISCYEGYKLGLERGYSITMRQSGKAVTESIAIYEILIEGLVNNMVSKHYKLKKLERHNALQQITINELINSLKYIESVKKRK